MYIYIYRASLFSLLYEKETLCTHRKSEFFVNTQDVPSREEFLDVSVSVLDTYWRYGSNWKNFRPNNFGYCNNSKRQERFLLPIYLELKRLYKEEMSGTIK